MSNFKIKLSIIKKNLRVWKLCITFAVDLEIVSWCNKKPNHKTRQFLANFESRHGNVKIRMTLTLENPDVNFFFQFERRQLANVRPPHDLDGKITIKNGVSQLIVAF